jgi:hypothetical protein
VQDPAAPAIAARQHDVTTSSRAVAVEPDARWLCRVGGVSALVLGAAYLAIFPLYASVGAPPKGLGEPWLAYLAGKTTVWWTIVALSVVTDLLFVPVGLALYAALKKVHKSAMSVATVFIGLFVVLDLAVTWSHYAALLTLSSSYSTATSDIQRAGYIAAANYAAAMLESRLFIVYAIGTLSFAILIIGAVMLKGTFSRATALLGLATGILGVVSIAGWGVTIILNAVFATVWLFFVGYRLCRLAQG